MNTVHLKKQPVINKRNGFQYERTFLNQRKKEGATLAIRHYGSKGVTDVEWTDQLGFKNEAQLKYSTIKMPKVSSKEMAKIIVYAQEKKKEGIKVWTVCKQARGAEVWEAMN